MESLGFTSVAYPDHFGRGQDFPKLSEPLVTLACVAGSTETLRLLPLVACNDFRHPVLYAKMIASLDILSDGRAEAGIGAGWMQDEYAALGIQFYDGRTRAEKLEEALQILKLYWDPAIDTLEFRGKHYTLSDLPTLKPLQRPNPPLLVGARRRLLTRVAAQYGDVIGTVFDSPAQHEPDHVANHLNMIRTTIRDVGRDPSRVPIQALITVGFGEEPRGPFWPVGGTSQEIIDELERRINLGISYFVLVTNNQDKIRRFGESILQELL